MENKSKVLVVGGTGFVGRRIVTASLAEGHPTYVLMRPEIGLDVDKLQMLLSYKARGARLLEASLEDHRSLVAAVRQVDVVVSAMSGVHFRNHNLMLQLKLVEAIKEAGNVKRFIPSEFGIDPSRMGDALEPGRVSFDEKMEIRRAIGEADIPHTYVSANCFAAYFCANLGQMKTLLPPKEKVCVYGDGNVKGRKRGTSAVKDPAIPVQPKRPAANHYDLKGEGLVKTLCPFVEHVREGKGQGQADVQVHPALTAERAREKQPDASAEAKKGAHQVNFGRLGTSDIEYDFLVNFRWHHLRRLGLDWGGQLWHLSVNTWRRQGLHGHWSIHWRTRVCSSSLHARHGRYWIV
ncbi:hypothetical protein GUJ93_ZPchr0009g1572 [Zizania palustris]|uniref:NmrA-like domain-containing protein n=1 Tax=Zizania palustris TaxID=103762 RepID=A0A8J5RX20_ZIZPA|nr:hypothetical protein GUJ93_ZPchr0009g1572 [Zizania palustris]